MSILIIQLPAQSRQSAGVPDGGTVPTDQREFAYVLSPQGVDVARQGSARLSAMPKADQVVAVMAPADLSWHRLRLPKAPAARLRQALGGMLEEHVLDDPDDLHMAVAPDARAGEECWVAVCRHTTLTARLVQFETARLRVDRVVPAAWPDSPETGFFHAADELGFDGADSPSTEVLLTWSSLQGVSTWPLSGSLARALLPEPLPDGTRLFASPSVAAPAERWLGHPVHSHPLGESLMRAARSPWNLLQFEWAPSSRGVQALSDRWRVFRSPTWRPVRVGLVALVLVQVLGLNAWAWHQRHDLAQRQARIEGILTAAHPQVRVVLDAPLQMQRETDALRAQSGQLGASDLESLMSAVAAAWPGGPPAKGLAYDGSSLSLVPPDTWGPGEASQFQAGLEGVGLASVQSGAQWNVRPAPSRP